MIEYYNETTKAIKTWDEIKLDNRNTSFPEGPPLNHILTELGYAGVAEIARPTASASTKEIVRDGVEKNSNGTWMQKWKEQDRFSGDNKSANDTAYQKDLDDKAALSVRGTRNELLEETDFYALSDVTMSDLMKTYRQNLRDVTKQAGFPHTISWPTKPS
tara:strand:+ start:256 stop:735 length:480 start_codon:yes stop_codon:yes gene_type:complete